MIRGRRIVFVLKSFLLGGAERQALLLARHLALDREARVHVIAYSNPQERAAEICARNGISHEYIPVRLHKKLYKLVPTLARLTLHLRRRQPDILIPFLNTPSITCGVLWRFTGARASIWGQRDQGLAHSGREIERWAMRHTPYFVANSEGGARYLIAAGARADRVRVIWNSVTLEPPGADPEIWRRRLGAGRDRLLVVMVAHFEPRKDHATLLEAWARVTTSLRVRGRRALLVLAGIPGTTHDESQSLTRHLGLTDDVRFLGEVRDISGLLAAMDVAVLCSHHEGCPNALQEYMAAGLAVVATDLPGIHEILEDPARLTPPRDPEALADRVLELLDDPDLRARLGARHRGRAETELSPQRLYEAWDRLLEECLEGLNRS